MGDEDQEKEPTMDEKMDALLSIVAGMANDVAVIRRYWFEFNERGKAVELIMGGGGNA